MLKYFLILTILQFSGSQYISCSSVWIKQSNGEFPPDSVEAGNGDLVVRVQDGSKFFFGRLSITDKLAYVPASSALAFTVYEVLGITTGCITLWVTINSDDIISNLNAIGNESGDFVARAEYDGFIVSGSISSDHSMKIVYKGDQVNILNGTIEVLTSVYPLLEADITDFSFDSEAVEKLESKGILKVISSEQVENLSEDVLSSNYHVNFEQSIQEFFELKESKEWVGVQMVQQTLLLWFGSPIISDVFDVSISKTIMLSRERSLKISKDLMLVNVSNINICSYAYMITDEVNLPIPYTAIATFSGSQLTSKQVNEVLDATGRKDILSTSGETVRAKINGTISGKFALRIVSRTENNEDGSSPCIEHARQYNTEQSYFKL